MEVVFLEAPHNMKLIPFSKIKKQLLKNKAFKAEYDALEAEFTLAAQLIAKRLERGMTQGQLAKKLGTRQSAIARLESGSYNPSLALLGRVAKALDTRLEVSLR